MGFEVMNGSNRALAAIGLDWGTTNARAYAFARDGSVLWTRAGPWGLAAAQQGEGFAAAFERLTEGRGGAPAIACGMIGAKGGWREAPYVRAPASLAALADGCVEAAPDVLIAPGVAQDDPPDVMRGEETKILGLAAMGAGDGIVCLPGTHSKWAEIDGGALARFRTCMTGDLYAAVSRHTILSRSIEPGEDDAAFERGVEAGLRGAEPFGTLAFRIRARGLLDGASGAAQGSELSGLLIGAELAQAQGRADAPVKLAAAPPLDEPYARAFEIAGVPFVRYDADEAASRGLLALARRLWPGRFDER